MEAGNHNIRKVVLPAVYFLSLIPRSFLEAAISSGLPSPFIAARNEFISRSPSGESFIFRRLAGFWKLENQGSPCSETKRTRSSMQRW